MARLFLGLDLPPEVDLHLELMSTGVPGARWEGRDKFHLTLLYLGEVDGRVQRGVIDALTGLRFAPFEMTLKGVGFFPPRGDPTSLWAGVADPGPVIALRQRIDARLRTVDVTPDARKFIPHVTLARTADSPVAAIVAYISDHVLFRSETFRVEELFLYSSVRTSKGSHYRREAGFPLRTAED
ncbi:MAG: RNA 2',3'-cyclic phosphodiesterase [Nannocystis sp.]|nr:RNA 2',3'-cyclic phosphodiesterase [Nannocystis sp.]MBA3545036.1 RNA 2',3'-cyclic phosphodiesterase [Nannocystis sp.]